MLCYLEGLTHEQAASQLRWPVGTVKTRLARGRERLRCRLSGLDRSCPAILPLALQRLTSEAAMHNAAHHGAAGAVSSAVTTITEGILKMMWFDRLRLTGITMVALIAAAGLGAPFIAQQVAGKGRASLVLGAQVEPVDKPGPQQVLRLSGTIIYDPNTLTIVRSEIDGRIDKVFVEVGQPVKKGDPLIELFSTELVKAKSDFETARSQHNRDLKTLNFKGRFGALASKELIEAENDEAKSRLAMKIAKDNLLIIGLTENEIGKVANEDGFQKAKMILRSRTDGVVMKRSVVQGNYYDGKDELMRIARLDHLCVRGRVSAQDADKVEVGQKLKIIFPYQQTIDTKVEHIDRTIDPATRSATFRTTIPNPQAASR